MKKVKALNYFLTILLIGTGLISCNKNEISMKNPLFNDLNQTIDFKSVTAQHVTDATSEAINLAKENLNNIYLVSSDKKTFENTMRLLDNIYNDLMKVNEVISLLAYVHPDDEIRNKCLESTAEFGKFFNEISLSEDLYKAVKKYASEEEADRLTGANKKYLKETVEEFERNGFALPKEKRDELKVIQDKLSDLGIQFDSNISSHKDF